MQYEEDFSSIGHVIVADVLCPVCKKACPFRELLYLTYEYVREYEDDGGGEERSTALVVVTRCCRGIVAKNHTFDFERGVHGYQEDRARMEGYTKFRSVYVHTTKPEILRTRKVRKPRPEQETIDEVALGE